MSSDIGLRLEPLLIPFNELLSWTCLLVLDGRDLPCRVDKVESANASISWLDIVLRDIGSSIAILYAILILNCHVLNFPALETTRHRYISHVIYALLINSILQQCSTIRRIELG